MHDPYAYRGPTAAAVARITYRQLDYWARTGIVEPTVREAAGSGTHRLYSSEDVVKLAVVRELLDAGLSLPVVRRALAALSESFTLHLSDRAVIIVDVDGIRAQVEEALAVCYSYRAVPDVPALSLVP